MKKRERDRNGRKDSKIQQLLWSTRRKARNSRKCRSQDNPGVSVAGLHQPSLTAVPKLSTDFSQTGSRNRLFQEHESDWLKCLPLTQSLLVTGNTHRNSEVGIWVSDTSQSERAGTSSTWCVHKITSCPTFGKTVYMLHSSVDSLDSISDRFCASVPSRACLECPKSFQMSVQVPVDPWTQPSDLDNFVCLQLAVLVPPVHSLGSTHGFIRLLWGWSLSQAWSLVGHWRCLFP